MVDCSIMHEVMNDDSNGPGAIPAIVFFVSFQFMAVFLTLNLFISVVVAYTQKADAEKWEKAQTDFEDTPGRKHYTTHSNQLQPALYLRNMTAGMEWSDIDGALVAWTELDPTATGAIHGAEELRTLVLQMGATGSALGAKDEADVAAIMAFIGAPP